MHILKKEKKTASIKPRVAFMGTEDYKFENKQNLTL